MEFNQSNQCHQYIDWFSMDEHKYATYSITVLYILHEPAK